MRSASILVFLFLISFTCHARQQIHDFGDIPKEQLQKSVYTIDSTASAVILFDVGETYMDTDMKVRYKRHVRIKILSDEGLEQGDVQIGFRTSEPEQKIYDLDVVTYNLNPNGKISEQKIGKRQAFKEEVTDSWSQLKFSVPGLKKGSVFEYRYEIISESPVDFKDWQFQKSIPVLWSEYTARIPQWFDFTTFVRSYYPMEIADQNAYNGTARVRVTPQDTPLGIEGSGQQRPRSYITRIPYVGTEYVWGMRDLPAIVDDPYINSAADYSAKILLQLNAYEMPQSPRRKVLTNWLDFIKLLETNEYFGERIESKKAFRRSIEDMVLEGMEPEEKVIALYNHVRDRMNWNEDYRLLATDDLDDLYKEGTANSSEINMILIQLLREAGIDADPVILSTRSHGEILDVFPIIDQFNHTLAYVKIGGKPYYLDATLKDKPFDLLPLESQNGRGLIVNQQKAAWIPLVNSMPATQTDLVTIKIEDDGSFSGTLESSYKGYYSYRHRQKFSEEDSLDAILKAVFDGNESIQLDSLTVKSNSGENVFSYKVQLTHQAQNSAPDVIYFNPFFLKGISENPFDKKEREYPVDFNFPFSQSLIMRITPPEGWEIDEMPKSKIVRLPGKLGEFKRLIQPSGNIIMMVFSLRINTYKIMPEQYPYLRQMFQELVEATSENMVLKKI